MTPAESAAQEALEEAGVEGVAQAEALGEYVYNKYSRDYRVRVFALRVDEVLDDWLEKDQRDRQWFSREEAAAVVKESGLREIIERFDVGAI